MDKLAPKKNRLTKTERTQNQIPKIFFVSCSDFVSKIFLLIG